MLGKNLFNIDLNAFFILKDQNWNKVREMPRIPDSQKNPQSSYIFFPNVSPPLQLEEHKDGQL